MMCFVNPEVNKLTIQIDILRLHKYAVHTMQNNNNNLGLILSTKTLRCVSEIVFDNATDICGKIIISNSLLFHFVSN